jgi:putative SOS response-associated peptidase YedK
MKDETPFFIGGMWDVWHAREPGALVTFTVLTTRYQRRFTIGCR